MTYVSLTYKMTWHLHYGHLSVTLIKSNYLVLTDSKYSERRVIVFAKFFFNNEIKNLLFVSCYRKSGVPEKIDSQK